MQLTILITFLTTLLLPLILATPPRSTQICYPSETTHLNCYNNTNHGMSQNITPSDLQSIAHFLRSYGRSSPTGQLWNMPASSTPDCAEWVLMSNGTVLALAKHIDHTVDTSVRYEDIANTLDGGENGNGSFMGFLGACGRDGGSLGTVVDYGAVAYKTQEYLASGASPDGILIKVVHAM